MLHLNCKCVIVGPFDCVVPWDRQVENLDTLMHLLFNFSEVGNFN